MNTTRRMVFRLSLLTLIFIPLLPSSMQAQVTVGGQVASVDGTAVKADLTLIRAEAPSRFRVITPTVKGRFPSRQTEPPTSSWWPRPMAMSHRKLRSTRPGPLPGSTSIFVCGPPERSRDVWSTRTETGLAGRRFTCATPVSCADHHFHHEVGDIHADDFGYFILPVVARGKSFVVEAATAERLPASTASLTLDGEEASGVQVTAGRIGFVVRGAVRDSAANPHAGASVRLRLFPSSKTTTAGRVSRLHARLLNQRTITGRDGAYEFKACRQEGRW